MDFLCSCSFCLTDDEKEDDLAFYNNFAKIYQMAEEMKDIRVNQFKSLSNARKEVALCKKLHDLSREKNIPPASLWEVIDQGKDLYRNGLSASYLFFKSLLRNRII